MLVLVAKLWSYKNVFLKPKYACRTKVRNKSSNGLLPEFQNWLPLLTERGWTGLVATFGHAGSWCQVEGGWSGDVGNGLLAIHCRGCNHCYTQRFF